MFRVIPVLLAAALPAAAQLPVSFTHSLSKIRTQVFAFKAEQVETGQEMLLQDIVALGDSVRDLAALATRLHPEISDLRRRAARIGDARRGSGPDSDPFFETALERRAGKAHDFLLDVEQAAHTLEWLSRDAVKNPELVEPVEELIADAQALSAAAQRLSFEAGWTAPELRVIGYNVEAWNLEHRTEDAAEKAAAFEKKAGLLLEKLQ